MKAWLKLFQTRTCIPVLHVNAKRRTKNTTEMQLPVLRCAFQGRPAESGASYLSHRPHCTWVWIAAQPRRWLARHATTEDTRTQCWHAELWGTSHGNNAKRLDTTSKCTSPVTSSGKLCSHTKSDTETWEFPTASCRCKGRQKYYFKTLR